MPDFSAFHPMHAAFQPCAYIMASADPLTTDTTPNRCSLAGHSSHPLPHFGAAPKVNMIDE